ncbi:unnamed protein product [Coregonus sp. 'balchen']|nr:unnamed protein product [Coregonus sp. 'balchen']
MLLYVSYKKKMLLKPAEFFIINLVRSNQDGGARSYTVALFFGCYILPCCAVTSSYTQILVTVPESRRPVEQHDSVSRAVPPTPGPSGPPIKTLLPIANTKKSVRVIVCGRKSLEIGSIEITLETVSSHTKTVGP